VGTLADMDVIRRLHNPQLRNPVGVVAFGGWNDACDVASTSAEFILDAHKRTEIFAELEADPFYDFQQQRPTISIHDGVSKPIHWPGVSITAVYRPADDRDLVVVTGQEPNFLWKTFSRSLVEVLDSVGVEEVILAGAYVGAVGHRDPVVLTGVGTDLVSVIHSGLESSNYRGPTGIVGAVQGACKEAGIRSISMWAPTPPYLAGNPFPRAVLAIVEKIADITNLHIDTSDLIAVDAEYSAKVDEAIENSGSELEEYLEEMESYDEPFLGPLLGRVESSDEPQLQRLDPDRTDALVDEIVKFLEGDAS
jgi:predicted ATP-grasp superfamily ATP-dependent carboligase